MVKKETPGASWLRGLIDLQGAPHFLAARAVVVAGLAGGRRFTIVVGYGSSHALVIALSGGVGGDNFLPLMTSSRPVSRVMLTIIADSGVFVKPPCSIPT